MGRRIVFLLWWIGHGGKWRTVMKSGIATKVGLSLGHFKSTSLSVAREALLTAGSKRSSRDIGKTVKGSCRAVQPMYGGDKVVLINTF